MPATPGPVLIEWDSRVFGLGIAEMDETHVQFVDLLNQLDTAPKSEFAELFAHLFEHTFAHFEEEKARMQQCRFPAMAEHNHEHRRVLGELAQIKEQVDKGRISFGRMYVREGLARWFRLHAVTMDSALAAHWKRHQGSQ